MFLNFDQRKTHLILNLYTLLHSLVCCPVCESKSFDIEHMPTTRVCLNLQISVDIKIRCEIIKYEPTHKVRNYGSLLILEHY